VFFVPNEPSSWTDLINESVHTSDDQDIGDIEAVRHNFIVQKKDLSTSISTTSLFTGLKAGKVK
jgi:hypothetical protein